MTRKIDFNLGRLPMGEIFDVGHNEWALRLGVVANVPMVVKKYEDSNILLSWMTSSGSKSVLGYGIEAKRAFPLVMPSLRFLALMSDVGKHENPRIVYADQKVRLYRFNKNTKPSYWFLLRHKR